MIGIFKMYGIDYVIINVDEKTKEEVLDEVQCQIYKKTLDKNKILC